MAITLDIARLNYRRMAETVRESWFEVTKMANFEGAKIDALIGFGKNCEAFGKALKQAETAEGISPDNIRDTADHICWALGGMIGKIYLLGTNNPVVTEALAEQKMRGDFSDLNLFSCEPSDFIMLKGADGSFRDHALVIANLNEAADSITNPDLKNLFTKLAEAQFHPPHRNGRGFWVDATEGRIVLSDIESASWLSERARQLDVVHRDAHEFVTRFCDEGEWRNIISPNFNTKIRPGADSTISLRFNDRDGVQRLVVQSLLVGKARD
jgi:hypothetical protein